MRLLLSAEHLVCLFFLVRQTITDTLYAVTRAGLHALSWFLTHPQAELLAAIILYVVGLGGQTS